MYYSRRQIRNGGFFLSTYLRVDVYDIMEPRQHKLYDSEFNKTTLAGLRVVGARVRDPRDRRKVRWLENKKKKKSRKIKIKNLKMTVVTLPQCGAVDGFLILISLIPVPVVQRVSVRR